MTCTHKPITILLADLNAGKPEAADQLLPLIYEDLRQIAARHFRRERAGHTLQPTALVHEAYLRLMTPGETRWENRAHFFASASRAMRRILVEHARQHGAEKRFGGQQRIDLDKALVFEPENPADFMTLHHALERLESLDPRQGRIVELRYFGGLSIHETAEVLHISATTVKDEWKLARAWLRREVEGEQ